MKTPITAIFFLLESFNFKTGAIGRIRMSISPTRLTALVAIVRLSVLLTHCDVLNVSKKLRLFRGAQSTPNKIVTIEFASKV